MSPARRARAGEVETGDRAAHARAVEAHRYLRARRGRRRPSLYQVYVVLLVGGIGGALAGHALATAIGGSLGTSGVVRFGPATLALAMLGALRFGVWQGPVAFSAADAVLLLSAPIPAGALVRPKLDAALATGAAAGALLGTGAVLLSPGGPSALGAGRAAAAIAAPSLFAACAVAASWLIESSRAATRAVLRFTPPAVALITALGVAALAAGPGRTAGIWSGPWGWALAPLTGVSGWPAAAGGLFVMTVVLTFVARWRTGVASRERFLAGADTRSGLTASAFTLDLRGAVLVHRAALPAAGPRTGGRVRRPRSPRRAILWRDALALRRSPGRAVWALVLIAAAVWDPVTHPGRALPALLGAIAAYLAASALLEPLRTDVDRPEVSRLLLSRRFADVVRDHLQLPAPLLWTDGWLAFAATVVAGKARVGVLALAVTVAPAALTATVVCAALTARRGGRVDPDTLGKVMALDPMNPGGTLLLVVALAPWLLADLVGLTALIALIGHIAAH